MKILIASSYMISAATASYYFRKSQAEAKKRPEKDRRVVIDLGEELKKVTAICHADGEVSAKLEAITALRSKIGTIESLSTSACFQQDLEVFHELAVLEEAVTSAAPKLEESTAPAAEEPDVEAIAKSVNLGKIESLVAKLEYKFNPQRKRSLQTLEELFDAVLTLEDPADVERLTTRLTALVPRSQKQAKSPKQAEAVAPVKSKDLIQIESLVDSLEAGFNPDDAKSMQRLENLFQAVLSLSGSESTEDVSARLTALVDRKPVGKPGKAAKGAVAAKKAAGAAAAEVPAKATSKLVQFSQTDLDEVAALYGPYDAVTILDAIQDYMMLPSYAVHMMELAKRKLAELKVASPADPSIRDAERMLEQVTADFRKKGLII